LPKKLYIAGVGPGSSKYLTDAVKDAIRGSQYLVGYGYTLTTIESIVDREKQRVFDVSIKTQDEVYRKVYETMKDGESCTIPFTGDANFSESEVVDRLIQIWGDENVEIIPGVSSIQVAASRSSVPLDKSFIVTFHVTGDIEQKKHELLNAVKDGKSVILLPRPWPTDLARNFMQPDIARFLRANGINTSNLKAWVFEYLTTDRETVFRGRVSDLEERKFNDLSVMVIDQTSPQTYLDFERSVA